MCIQESEKCLGNKDLSLEIKRQIFHLLFITLWCIPIYLFPLKLSVVVFLFIISLNILVILKVRPVYNFFHFLIVHLERKKNLEVPGIQALYANLGIFLSYILFGKLSVIGVLVLSVGDSFSTLVGKVFGKNRVFFSHDKSWEGTFTFFLSTFLVLLFFLPTEEALLVSSFSALFEAASIRIDDNLTIPLFATTLAYLV